MPSSRASRGTAPVDREVGVGEQRQDAPDVGLDAPLGRGAEIAVRTELGHHVQDAIHDPPDEVRHVGFQGPCHRRQEIRIGGPVTGGGHMATVSFYKAVVTGPVRSRSAS